MATIHNLAINSLDAQLLVLNGTFFQIMFINLPSHSFRTKKVPFSYIFCYWGEN